MQECASQQQANTPPGTRPLTPKPHVRPGEDANIIWGSSQAKVCAEKDHSCLPWQQLLPEHIKTLWE